MSPNIHPTISGTSSAGAIGLVRRPAAADLSRFALVMIGVTCAVCVANNYYGQPLLVNIAQDLGIPRGLSGLAPTLTQIGIALGMFFILPLGDRIDNRHITTGLLLVQSAALATMAATTVPSLYLTTGLVTGLCGIVTYLLPAYATRLVPAERRGAVTGLLATGTLTGIMLGRSMAGIIGYAIGWRSVYACAALATFAMAIVMKRTMPATPNLREDDYAALMRSQLRLFATTPLLRRATLLQALSFGSFNALWVGLALLLQDAPFHLDTRQIGMLALVAVAAAIAAPKLGRLVDRHSVARTTIQGFGTTALGWIALLAMPSGYPAVVIAMVAVSIGALTTDIALRAALYGLAPDIRMRLNAFYSTGTFAGGAALSLATPLIWANFGWTAIAVVALAINVAGACLARSGLHVR